MLVLSRTSPPLGLGLQDFDIEGIPSLDISKDEIVICDFYRSKSTNALTGNGSSVYARIIRPTATSVYGGPPHAIALAACSAGQVGKFRIAGVVRGMTLPAAAVNGSALSAGGSVEGVRVFGFVLNKTATTAGDVLWSGVNGFGQVHLTGANLPPEAVLTATPDTGDAPLSVTLDASGSSDADGTIARYEFNLDVGGGWINNGTDADLVYVYPDAGVYDPSVRITDDDGAQDIATARVIVSDPTSSGSGDVPEDPPATEIDDDGVLGEETVVSVVDDA